MTRAHDPTSNDPTSNDPTSNDPRAEPPRPAGAEPLEAATRQRTYQALGNHPLLEHAADATVTRFLEALRLYRLPPGACLLEEGQRAQAVFFLTEGVVRIVHRHGEAAFTPKVLAAPCHFGHMELLAGLPSAFQSVDAMSGVVVAELSWTEARNLLLEDHALALAWLEDLAVQFVHTADAIRHYAFGDLRARVASVLLSYADISAAASGAGAAAAGEGDAARAPDEAVAIDFPLSLNTLSRHVASPKRCVLRVMQSLQEDKLLTGDKRGGLTVPNRARLAAAMPFRRLGLNHRARLPEVLVRRGKPPEQ